MSKSSTVCLILIASVSACVIGCCDLDDLIRDKEPVVVVQRSAVDYPDYEWLAGRLARRRTVSTEMLLGRLGLPKSTQESAIGLDSCWYYECLSEDGLPRKLQVVVSDKATVRRARLY